MTRSRGTLLLLSLAGALLGYILVFERGQPDAGQRAEQSRRLFPELDPARVSGLTISRTNGTLRAERVQGQWRLATPPYPAQGVLVENWVESVATLRRVAHLEATDLLAQPGGLAALGLDPPQVTITLEQGMRRVQFRLGHRTPLGERMYLQVVGADGVEVTAAQPLERLPVSAADWRDPTFLQLGGLAVDRIQLRAPAREFAVQRDPTQRRWQLTRPRPARADHGRVEQLLQQLLTTRVVHYASDFAAADLEPYGLQTPAATLTLSSGTNAFVTIEFGSSPTNAPDLLYARRSNLPGVVAIPRATFDQVALPYTDLLDYRLVEAPLETAGKVEVEAGTRFVVQRLASGGWRITEPLEMPADPGLMATFLERLSTLRIVEVAKEVVAEPELPAYGLATPVRQYTLHWPETPSPGATSAWLRLDFGTNRADRVFARRSDENPIYALRLEDCVTLPAAAFELRDRRLWDFATNQVQSITITHQGAPQKLIRSPSGQWTFAVGSQGLVNTLALEEAMHRLGQLRAAYWRAQGPSADLAEFGVPQVAHRLTIDLLIGGKPETRTLDFGARSPSGGPFALVTLEGGPTVFELPLDISHPYEEVVRGMALPKPAQR